MALIGHVDQISRSLIEGWAIDPGRPDEPVSVSILVNGAQRGMCLTTRERPDLKLPNGEKITGKCAFSFNFEPPLSPFVELRIDVIETWSGQLLPNGSDVLPRPRSHDGVGGGPVPILLTSTGRTGTTLLMSEFVRHPDIVAGDHFPYEIKQIAYYAAAFRALAADADRERSTTPETMLAPELAHAIGGNPFNLSGFFGLGAASDTLRDFYRNTVPSGYASLFRRFILEFYATLARAQGKQSAPFICEKGDIDDAAVQGARLFFDAVKDIVIFRDPRDLLCSAIAFWKLSPEATLSMLATTIPRLARIARDAGPDTIVIRYEDLVRDPVRTRRALSDFLDLDLLSQSARAAGSIPDSHRTSSDPAASIGRWRNDLTADQIDACETTFAPYMREFGYELTGRARAVSAGRAAGKEVLAAEGGLAVAALAEDFSTGGQDGERLRQMLELTFGQDGSGTAFTLEGWSTPERGFVWSDAPEARIRLPAIRSAGNYRLAITARPFTHEPTLPSQLVTLLLNDQPAGVARVGDICVLSIPVPAEVAETGDGINLRFRFPDAARPSEIVGAEDDRLLGLSLYRVALFRLETEPGEA